jgi:hypothetical protein
LRQVPHARGRSTITRLRPEAAYSPKIASSAEDPVLRASSEQT